MRTSTAIQRRPEERRLSQLYRRIVLILKCGFFLALGLMLLGIIVAILRDQSIGDSTDPLSELFDSLRALEGQAILELGILVMLATPFSYVLVSLVTFVRQRDKVFVEVCLVLIAILLGSVGIALL
jgi:uncharacterized membrane protein